MSAAGCGCKSNIIEKLAGLGVKVMLAGNIGGGAVNKLSNNGIAVIRGCSGDVKTVLTDWLNGKIQDNGELCAEHEHHHEHNHNHQHHHRHGDENQK
jgi:predicted Fe-Mo cluster-binding NifX family protein